MTDTTYNAADEGREQITAALVGRRIAAIIRTPNGDYGDRATIQLDDGTVLQLDGHDGGCACDAGCYELSALASLADVDNIITAVQFEDAPASDYDDGPLEGHYTLFVVADDRRINLATFTGSDGNGYYGTGYYVRIIQPAKEG